MMTGKDIKKIKATMLRFAILLLAIVIISVLRPQAFLTYNNFISILLAMCIYGILACGKIYVLLSGEIDLSIGSIVALSGIVMIMTSITFGNTMYGTCIGIAAGLLVSVLCGLLNGIFCYYFHIPSFVITLATQQMILGIAQLLTNQRTIINLDSSLIQWLGSGRILGIPTPGIVFIVSIFITYIILNRTVFGKYVYASGGNRIATKYSGINSTHMGVLSFVICGFMAGLAGIILSCMNRQALASQGSGYEGTVIVALVVGGVSLAGGEGSILGSIFGLAIIGIINNAMTLLGIDSVYQQLVQGVIVVIAVSADIYTRNRGNGLKRELFRRKRKV